MIFIVSLERSQDRRQKIATAMEQLALPFRFIDAVDAGRHSLAPVATAEEIRSAMLRDMTAGELACALSHRKAYEKFLATDHSHVVILEDDAIPTPDFGRFIREDGHKHYPMILFYHSGARVVRKTATTILGSFHLFRVAMSCNGAVAYSLNRTAAQALLERSTPVCRKADWPLDISTLKAVAVVPPIVEHPDRSADPAQSLLSEDRPKSTRPKIRRFLSRSYYRRKLKKLASKKVS
jgi:glycosyl transferase family 25